MEPGHPLETLHGEADHDGVCVTSWVSVCPRGLWKVQRKRIHSGVQQTASDSAFSSINCPRLGSLCRVRVHLKSNADEAESLACETRGEKLAAQPSLSVADVIESGATPFVRCKDSVLQVPLGDWTTLRLGDGQCDITEACLEGMRAGEMCEIQLSPMETGPDVPHPSDEGLPLCATVELQAFTPGKESWEMSPSEKWERVKSHKETGGVRFRSEDLWGAADSYSKAIKLVITLYNHIRDVQKKRCEYEAEEQRDPNATVEKLHPSAEELSTMKAELHSNLSLCQLKLNQPEWAKANAAKATQLEPGCAKAWYRLGKACQIVNELEEAKRAYRKLLELQPEMPAALKALKEIASREKETNAQLGLRLSKMFS
ncbi:FK506-binding protein 59 [Archocentrus centrarchus]|uniref:FK506-binding protein 59 n=1 Tax=Archocentrus centrarchus TaxID=63155 RepID=UPI0011E9CF66|nr:FK506-binding protein 59-like [Archocentrus centrarchus]